MQLRLINQPLVCKGDGLVHAILIVVEFIVVGRRNLSIGLPGRERVVELPGIFRCAVGIGGPMDDQRRRFNATRASHRVEGE